MRDIYEKYAELLIKYSLNLKKGERLFIASTYLAEPLLMELQCFIDSVKRNEVLDPLCNTQEALQVLEVADSAFSKLGLKNKCDTL